MLTLSHLSKLQDSGALAFDQAAWTSLSFASFNLSISRSDHGVCGTSVEGNQLGNDDDA